MNYPKSKVFEQLAAIEHERWSDLAKNVFRVCEEGSDGTLVIPSWAVRKWQRQIDTPYQNLTEEEKDLYRDQVMRYWGLIDELNDWGFEDQNDC